MIKNLLKYANFLSFQSLSTTYDDPCVEFSCISVLPKQIYSINSIIVREMR